MEALSSAPPPKSSQRSRQLPINSIVAWSIGLIVAAVLVTILYLTAPSAYTDAKLWRAGHFASRGARFFEQADWEEAVENYRLANQLAPNNIEYLRKTAQASENISVKRANELWNDIMGRSRISTTERQDYIEFLLRIGRLDVASEQLRYLLMAKPTPARSYALAAEFFRKRGDSETSLRLAKQALIAAPEDPEIQFQLGQQLAAENTRSERLEGRQLLWDLARRPNSMRVDSWKELAGLSELAASLPPTTAT